MNIEKMIEKYQIKLAPDGISLAIPGGAKLPKEAIEEIKFVKSEIVKFFKDKKANEEKKYQERETKINTIPGLKELKESIINKGAYSAAMNEMMEDEQNDGVRSPAKTAGKTPAELAKEFPVAALWLKADDHCNSNNVHKFSSGEKAKNLILEDKIEEAKEVLKNWLPESSKWD